VWALADQFGKTGKGQSLLELRRSDGQHHSPPALSQLSCDRKQAALPGTGIADRDRAPATDHEVTHDSLSVLAAKQLQRGRRFLHEDIILSPARP